MVRRVKKAIATARYGAVLYPHWEWLIDHRDQCLEITAPGEKLTARWAFGDGESITDENLRLAIDMLVVTYIQNVKATSKRNISAPEA